ncbi:hypothetical protein AGMMS50276_26580 [Synergistales bacterium]|nr:hypothetical protein AGMMS50276_26580 [Synergistales bacterium]
MDGRDLKKRISAHSDGRGAKYTKSRRPVTLVYSEEFSSKSDAMRHEAAIKKLPRLAKLKLTREHNVTIPLKNSENTRC